MRAICIVMIALAVCPSSEAWANDKNVDTWRHLWTRCRIAIERGESLDVRGLSDLGASVRRVAPLTAEGLSQPLMRGYEVHERSWQLPGSSYIVVEEGYPQQRRSCAVRLAPNVPATTPDEEANFVVAFLQERRLLVTEETHEERDPAPIFSTNLGVGPLARSENGCSIISGLQIETRPGREPFFSSFSGEQDRCLSRP